jgi:RNA polymerase sigma-70 factor (ECF subfamily)
MTGARLTSAEPSASLAAFEALYREHFAFAWRALRRLGVPERDLMDAAQDVFVVVHRRFAELDPASRVTTWLYAICLRVASDRRRSASARHELLAEPPEAPAGADEAEQLRLRAHRRILYAALEQMPLEQRAVFTLFELEGASGEEIAAALAVPVPTVHSRLRRARETFRAVLEREQARERFDELKIGGQS